jgi:hypothetical protein
MSPASHTSSSRRVAHKQEREERETYDRRGPGTDDARRQTDGDVLMGDAHPYSPRSASRRAKEGGQKFEDEASQSSHPSQASHYHSANSSRSSSRHKRSSSTRPTVATREDFFPPPPEGSVRTRCYRLNLDVGPAVLSPTHDSLGPFHYTVPMHLQPSNGRMISHSMSYEEEDKTPAQIAVDTARIFRGIKVDNNGTIVGRNDRASRSSRKNQNTAKTAENSRQSAKISKANDLVDEMVTSGKENDGEKPNMISIIVVGEYDDMKQLVRDGAKKLREADGRADDALLSLNRRRGSPVTSIRRTGSEYPASPSSASRRRLGSASQQYEEIPGTPTSNSSRSKSRTRMTAPASAPPKLKGHPRDRPSSRSERNTRVSEKCNNMSLFGGEDSDWSEALNFNSIWNCGGTGGTGTMSPSNNVDTPTSGRSMSKVRYEGRNDATSTRNFSRGVSERDAPLIL